MLPIVSALLITLVYTAAGQSQEKLPEFDAASVKPVRPPDQSGAKRGVPRSTGIIRMPDPGSFVCDFCTLSDLVLSAFHIQSFQLSAPSWMEEEHYAVNARVPKGTTPEHLRLMQQSLLAERFKLTYHHESKEMGRSELVVAKEGPKLKPSPGPPSAIDGREPGATIAPNGRINASYFDTSMAELADILAKQVHEPVTDATGLQGKFDFILTWTMDRGVPSPDGEAGPTIFDALKTAGLKLEQKKGVVDRIVIDHAEKVPAGN